MRFTWRLTLPILLISLCRADDNGCTVPHNVEELRQLRLEHLKTNILAQLGFTEPPMIPPPEEETASTPQELDSDIVDSYNQLESDSFTESKCTSGDFFAKPINSFVGVLSPAEGKCSNIVVDYQPQNQFSSTNYGGDVAGLVSRYRRAVKMDELESHLEEQEVVVEAGILNQYTIAVNFNLPENMSRISRANLVLYQDVANTIENEVLDRYQLVQIRTVINNVRYFVEKKSVDVYGYDLQSFDVTRAVELWVQEGVSGSVILEVLVTCYSSPNCSQPTNTGKLPAKVSFVQNASDPSKLPRIITISKNPLEQESEPYRRKRQAETTELEFCTANQSTCCLQPLTINFKDDLNFGFVSKPKSFDANFCDGYCPEVSGIGLMTSQRFQLLRYLSSSPTSSIEPCCTGLEYKPLQILVDVYNPITERVETRLDKLDQVIVTKCRCG